LSFRIPFPDELKISSDSGPQVYHLKGFVVHAGQGLSYGHYYALVKSQGKWINFNDTHVSIVEDIETHQYYGAPPLGGGSQSPVAYMLLYESEDSLKQMPQIENSK
jgi:ubiquitin C-terminal hydrolase